MHNFNGFGPKSYQLRDEKVLLDLFDSHREDMLFFMGFRGDKSKVTSVWQESIQFFMAVGLIPKFPLDAGGFEGRYISWRLGGEKRDYLMGRVVEIHKSGNVRLTYKDNVYYGKCHFFESNNHYHKLIFTIDKKIRSGEQIVSHRSHYVFVTKDKTKLEDGQFMYGISAIISQHDTARVGEEVLIRCDNPPEDAHTLDIKTGTPQDIAKMTDEQRNIFYYLQKGVVLKVKREASNQLARLEEDINWGRVLFESAYYKAALRTKELNRFQLNWQRFLIN